MALIQSAGSGFYDVGGSWVGGVPPGAADTFNINATHTITTRNAGGAITNGGGTIAIGGKLSIQSTVGYTMTGAVAWNGTFEALGSGSNATPTLITANVIWTRGGSSLANIVGTLNVTAPDVLFVGGAVARINFQLVSYINDIITKAEFRTHSNGAAYVFGAMNGYVGDGSNYSDILFSNCASYSVIAGPVNLSGTILISGGLVAGAFDFSSAIYGSALIKLINIVAANYGRISTTVFYGTTIFHRNDPVACTTYLASGNCSFRESTKMIVDNAGVGAAGIGVFSGMSFLDHSMIDLNTTSANPTIFYGCNITTDGLIDLKGPNGLALTENNSYINASNIRISVTTGTVVLTRYHTLVLRFQQTRSKRLRILGATTITLVGPVSKPQYDGVVYEHDEALYLFGMQYDMTYLCPNYTALYGASTGWTSSTKTLAAGGVLRIYTTGLDTNGLDMAISSFAGFALATSGTATINTAVYYISFDGGVLWSAALTAAQLQTNTYIINGNTYYTDPRYNIQLRISLTSTLGGTVQQVRVTGITYNPAVTQSWNVRWNFEQDEGVGFDTNNDSFHQISTHKLGTPVALSGGTADISNNLIKMADNAGGGAFNSATDSLHELGILINGLSVVVSAALQPILSYCKKIWNYLQGHSKIRIDRNEKQ